VTASCGRALKEEGGKPKHASCHAGMNREWQSGDRDAMGDEIDGRPVPYERVRRNAAKSRFGGNNHKPGRCDSGADGIGGSRQNIVSIRATASTKRDAPGAHAMHQEVTFGPVTSSHNLDELRTFLTEMGWGERIDDRARFAAMIARADRTVVVTASDRIVGFGRALCDGVSNGYLSMLAVHPEFRGGGIGREIVRRLIGDDPHITWVLRAGRDSAEFWRKVGFVSSEIAMEHVRTDGAEVRPEIADPH